MAPLEPGFEQNLEQEWCRRSEFRNLFADSGLRNQPPGIAGAIGIVLLLRRSSQEKATLFSHLSGPGQVTKCAAGLLGPLVTFCKRPSGNFLAVRAAE